MRFGLTRLWKLLALLAAGSLILAACGNDKKDDNASDTTTTAKSGSSSGVKCSGIALGFFGALTGDNASLGINERNGAKVALKAWNDDNKDCQVKLVEFDSQGDQTQAPQLAQKAIQDTSVIGLIGPAFSGESKTGDPIFDQAGLATITPSATNIHLSENGWKVFHRGVGNDNTQGPAISNYLKNELNAKSIAVLDDKSEYGKGIADIVRKDFGAGVKVNDSFDDKTTEFSSTVNKVKAGNVDAVVFGGYYSQAGPLAKQLKEGGVTAQFIAPDGSNDDKFIEGAGTAAEGALLTAPSAPADKVEGAAEFLTSYKEINGKDAALYSIEAFDIANVYLDCIKKGNTTREKIQTCLGTTEYKGLAKTYKWDAKGELAGAVTIYLYKVTGGKIVGVGPMD